MIGQLLQIQPPMMNLGFGQRLYADNNDPAFILAFFFSCCCHRIIYPTIIAIIVVLYIHHIRPFLHHPVYILDIFPPFLIPTQEIFWFIPPLSPGFQRKNEEKGKRRHAGTRSIVVCGTKGW